MTGRFLRHGGVTIQLDAPATPEPSLLLVPSTAGGVSADAGQASPVASATPHAVGTWAEVVTDADSAADGVRVTLRANTGQTGTDTSTLLDVGVDQSGGTTYVPLVQSIPIGWSVLGYSVQVPVAINLGARVAVRVRSIVASKQVDVTVNLMRGEYTTVPTVLGVSTAASRGTVLTASAGPTSLTAFQTITASAAASYRAFRVCVQGGGDATAGAGGIRVDVGADGQLLGTTYWHMLGTEIYWPVSDQLIVLETPTEIGDTIQARWAGPSASGIDVTLLAYPVV